MVKEGRLKSQQSQPLRDWGWKGGQAEKVLQLHCRSKCECFRMVLWSGRVAHQVMFLCDQRFSRAGPYCGDAVWRLGPQQRARTPCPPSWGQLSCVCWFHSCIAVSSQGIHLCGALCHHLLKVLSEMCDKKTPSYGYNCRVINDVYVNYPVKADVRLHRCESQKHQLCKTENTFSRTEELETLPRRQTFTSLHLCLSWKRARGKLQVPPSNYDSLQMGSWLLTGLSCGGHTSPWACSMPSSSAGSRVTELVSAPVGAVLISSLPIGLATLLVVTPTGETKF